MLLLFFESLLSSQQSEVLSEGHAAVGPSPSIARSSQLITRQPKANYLRNGFIQKESRDTKSEEGEPRGVPTVNDETQNKKTVKCTGADHGVISLA